MMIFSPRLFYSPIFNYPFLHSLITNSPCLTKTLLKAVHVIVVSLVFVSGALNAQSLSVTASTQLQSATNAIDGDFNTRWESEWDIDPGWITVDLGKIKAVNSMTIYWEAANARDYLVRGWNGVNWDTLASEEGKPAGNRTDYIPLSGNYQYIQIYGTARSMGWGYSIWEIEIDASPVTALPNPEWSVTASTQVQSAEFAIDGDVNTRWQSENINPSWITVDLGRLKQLNQISIQWADDNAKAYEIRAWNGVNWDTLATVVDKPAGARVDTVDLEGEYQFVQVYTLERSGQTGFSIWEISIDTDELNYVTPVSVTSSTQVTAAELAIDENINTRWESENINPSWITVDLGSTKIVRGMRIRWSALNAKDYMIRGWNGISWDTLATLRDQPTGGRIDTPKFSGEYQHLQIYTLARNGNAPFSIWEIEVDVAE